MQLQMPAQTCRARDDALLQLADSSAANGEIDRGEGAYMATESDRHSPVAFVNIVETTARAFSVSVVT